MFKRVILSSFIVFSSLIADSVMVSPEFGKISYDNDIAKSIKDSSNIIGIKADIENEYYLVELYGDYIDTSYKDSNLTADKNLVQSDIVAKYTGKFETSAFSIGLHYLYSDESEQNRDLGKGLIGMIGMETYLWPYFDRLTFGIEVYYSAYMKGYDEVLKSELVLVDIAQFTPYFVYDSEITNYKHNKLMIKANYVRAGQYIDKNYISFEVSDLYTYYDLSLELLYFGGEMKSGVTDSLLIVRNNKDLMKNGFSVKLGYQILPELSVSGYYRSDSFNEYNRFTRTYNDESKSSEFKIMASYHF